MKRSCLHLVNKAAVSLLLFLCVTHFYELCYNINYTQCHEIKKYKIIRKVQKYCVLFPVHACVAYGTERYVAARCVALRCVAYFSKLSLRCVAIRYGRLRCVPLRYVTLPVAGNWALLPY